MDRTTCEHFTPAGLPCDECVYLKSCACSDCNQEVLQLRDDVAATTGLLVRANEEIERLRDDMVATTGLLVRANEENEHLHGLIRDAAAFLARAPAATEE